MKNFVFFIFLFFARYCLAQNNNPAPPFSNIYRKPNIHPYTFIGPANNAMDYQQMFYLKEKYNLNDDLYQKLPKKLNQPYFENKSQQGIRTTGHKTYFMNIP